MELYEGIRNALKKRGCPWIEEHVFVFLGQRLHLDIHELGQNYILKIVHHAADKKKAEIAIALQEKIALMRKAQEIYASYSQEQVDALVKAMALTSMVPRSPMLVMAIFGPKLMSS